MYGMDEETQAEVPVGTTEVPENWDELTDDEKMEVADRILTDAAAEVAIDAKVDDAPRVFIDPDSVG